MALLEVKNLGISFGGLRAVDEFSITIAKGQLYGLIGPNGAGKTTLMKVLFGLENPQSGQVFMDGEPVKILNPLDAISKGIGMVHQHFMLLPDGGGKRCSWNRTDEERIF